MLKLLSLLMICVWAASAAALADCTVRKGSRIVLYGNSGDPDVFVWDSKQRLLDYSSGTYDIDRMLVPHALLTHPGTRALVESCIPNIVHPKFQFAVDDAIGVKILSGSYHGRYGWIKAGDMRTTRRDR
ncbi:MAG: hypothetical protein M3Y21_08065 [Candidatus Eremiobacteraeota bacterium]|nr:hypothetical protein [Candidatus Eremiobacteraeota bacterium]